MNKNRPKTISIFIGSSINEFREERMELENFIHRLSNDFEDRYNTRIRPIVCEAFDPAMARTRKQDEYNESLRNSDMCFFLFYTRAGEYTVEEFRLAVEAFRLNNTPKVYVYFKELNENDRVEQSLTDFMREVDRTYKHYYSTFAYLDTVKLCMLLNIKLNAMDYLPIEVKDGKCEVDGKDMGEIDLSKVTEFANSRDLMFLQEEFASTEEKYLQMKPVYAKGGADEDFYREYAKVAARREKLKKDLEELRKATFELMLNINRNFAAGEISPRMKEAHRLLELGDKESCVKLLTEEENIDEYHLRQRRRAEEQRRREEEAKKDASNYIKEQRFAISVLKTMYRYANRHEEIDRIYRDVVVEAERYAVEVDVLYDYAGFLWNQKQYREAIGYAEKLQEYYDGNRASFSEDDIARLNNLLGTLYSDTQRFAEAEKCHQQAIAIYERLAKDNPAAFEPVLAGSLNNLGNLYYKTRRFAEAEKCHRQAIEIRKRLAKDNPAAFEPALAMSLNNLGNLYYKTQRFAEAEKCYQQAIEIQERLAKDNPAAFAPDLAMSLNNLGSLYSDTQRFIEAEKCHQQAIEIYERLAKDNSAALEPDLAMSWNNLGVLYRDTRRFAEAEKSYQQAIEIYERLAKDNPSAFEPDLATSLNNLGYLYYKTQRFAEAEKCHRQAIEIRKRLAKDNPAAFEPALAMSLNNLGNLYSDTQRFAEAEKCHQQAIEIRKRLAKDNPAAFEPYLATSCFNLGVLYYESSDYTNAEKCFKKAKESFLGAEQVNPGLYTKQVHTCEQILQWLHNASE